MFSILAAAAIQAVSPSPAPVYSDPATWLCRPGRKDACSQDQSTTGEAARLAVGAPDAREIVSFRRKRAFLMALSTTGNLTMACAAAGWPRSFPSSLRKADKEFAEQWEFACETAADLLEASALQRAVHGVNEDVWYKPKEGAPEVIGHKTVYSDRLLETLLKANRPEKFRERHEVKHEGNKGGVLVVPATVPLDEWTAAVYRQQAPYREKREED